MSTEDRSEVPKRLYSNFVQIESSLYDFAITFSWRDRRQAEANTADVQAVVYMSPEHAKSVLFVLKSQTEAWEKQFGTLNVREEMLRPSSEEPPARADE